MLTTFEDRINKESYISNNLNKAMIKTELEDMVLLTGDKQKITWLGGEILGSILLDCVCSANVAGEGW